MNVSSENECWRTCWCWWAAGGGGCVLGAAVTLECFRTFALHSPVPYQPPARLEAPRDSSEGTSWNPCPGWSSYSSVSCWLMHKGLCSLESDLTVPEFKPFGIAGNEWCTQHLNVWERPKLNSNLIERNQCVE